MLAVRKGSGMLSKIKGVKLITRADDYRKINNASLKTDMLATLVYSKISGKNLNDISAGTQVV